MEQYDNFHVVDHPLIRHKLTLIRDKETGHQLFRELVNEVGTLVAFELTRDIPSQPVSVETPLTIADGTTVNGKDVVLVPILRAGLGMVDGLIKLIPNARVGYVGMERDETTHEPVHYYFKIPKKAKGRNYIIVDPMLATGGTAIATVDSLKELGAKHIKFMCLIAAPEGISRLHADHPHVPVHVAEVDSRLNSVGFIMPGLGDAGDRQFAT